MIVQASWALLASAMSRWLDFDNAKARWASCDQPIEDLEPKVFVRHVPPTLEMKWALQSFPKVVNDGAIITVNDCRDPKLERDQGSVCLSSQNIPPASGHRARTFQLEVIVCAVSCHNNCPCR